MGKKEQRYITYLTNSFGYAGQVNFLLQALNKIIILFI